MRPINTIAITTHNKFDLTRALIECLCMTLPLQHHEILIVDDNSTDDTLSLKNKFRFVSNDSGGLYRSWNLAIQSVNTPYVTILNNDLMFQQRNWWWWLYRALTETSYEFVYPINYETGLFDYLTYNQLVAADDHAGLEVKDGSGDIKAACFCAHTSLFDKVGLFDENFQIWYGEKDFEIRMLQESVRYGCVRNAVSRHLGSQTIQVQNVQAENTSRMTLRAQSDYEVFRKKYTDDELSRLGLSIKPFGHAALLD